MAVNLTLIPERWPLGGPPLCSQKMLLDLVDRDLWTKIRAEAIPLPEGVMHYEDDRGLRRRFDDPYGDPLMWMPAHSVARLLSPAVRESQWDRATLGYLRAIPPATRVVLWWS